MIPALVKPQPIDHIFEIDSQRIRVFGSIDLEMRTITASVTLVDGEPVNPKIDLDIKRVLHQVGYKNYAITLQY